MHIVSLYTKLRIFSIVSKSLMMSYWLSSTILGKHNAGSYEEKEFVQHLTTCGWKMASAKAAAKSIKYFLGYKPYTQCTTKDILMNRTNIRNYIHHLKTTKGYAKTTILERVGWLTTAIDFIMENDKLTIKYHLSVKAIKNTSNIKSKTLIKEKHAT